MFINKSLPPVADSAIFFYLCHLQVQCLIENQVFLQSATERSVKNVSKCTETLPDTPRPTTPHPMVGEIM